MARKQVVKYLCSQYQTGLNICCSLLSLSRSSFYYQSRKDDGDIITKLQEMVNKLPNRGFDTYYHRIRHEGYKWSRSKLLRVYRAMGLVKRPRKRRKLPESERKPLYTASELNHVWSMDFMSDSLSDGRTLRVLNIIDDHNRECLASHGSISYPSARVIDRLEQLKEEVGLPRYLRTDNGPEFKSWEYTTWCKNNGVTAIYSRPGKPMENGYVERFNRTFREDVLDAFYFNTVGQFNIIAEKWSDDYNDKHPHKSLGHKSPKSFAKRNYLIIGASPNDQSNTRIL